MRSLSAGGSRRRMAAWINRCSWNPAGSRRTSEKLTAAPTASLSSSRSLVLARRSDSWSGEQCQRNRFGRKECADLQQRQRPRVDGPQLLQGQLPGGVDPTLVVDDVTAGEQRRPTMDELPQVLLRVHPGLLHVGGGLRHGQRQVAEFGGQIRSASSSGGRRQPFQQQRHGLGPVEDVDLQPPTQRPPARVAGRDQDVSALGRPERGDVLDPFGVVEDQQPVRPVRQMRLEPFDGVGGDAGRRSAQAAARADRPAAESAPVARRRSTRRARTRRPYRWAYSMTSWLLPTPPMPYIACTTRVASWLSSRARQLLQHAGPAGEVRIAGRHIPDLRQQVRRDWSPPSAPADRRRGRRHLAAARRLVGGTQSSCGSCARMAASSSCRGRPGSTPSSSDSTERALRNASSAAACRPERYRLSISCSCICSCSGCSGDQGLQLADEFGVPAQRQVRLHPGAERRQPKFLQAGDLGRREGQRGEFGERGAAPQREGLPQARGGQLRGRAASTWLPCSRQPLEQGQVESVRVDAAADSRDSCAAAEPSRRRRPGGR